MANSVSNSSKAGKTKVAVFGLGYIGRLVFEAIQNENFFFNQPLELVGAVDIVAESCDWAAARGVPAYSSVEELLRNKSKPDVCILTTTTSLSMIVPQLKELIAAQIPVVSSSEELFFPWVRHSEIAAELNELCVKNSVAVLGTGVNPGFIMDVLPAAMTQVCQTVERIQVTRIVNASTRRLPLQRRIGVGLDADTFRAQAASGRIAPAGLLESLDFLAAYLGWTLTESEQKLDPILATKAIKTPAFAVKKDHVAGYRQQAWGMIDRKKVIELDLKVYLEAQRPGDQIIMHGTPPLNLWIDGGVNGDAGSVASLIRGIPIVLKARPGIVRRLERGYFVA